jgi:hypothetical protein
MKPNLRALPMKMTTSDMNGRPLTDLEVFRPRAITRLFAVVVCLLVACGSSDKQKNDRIAACTASGGQWSEGCGNGHCERSNGALDDDDPFEDLPLDAASSGAE